MAMHNSLADLKSVFWNMTRMCLKDIITEEPNRWIRKMYPKDGAPDWTIDDNIVFFNLDIRDDDYGKQRDSIYKTEQGTAVKKTMRTRVWDLTVNAYGPRAYEMTTAMQDGVFLQSVKRYLAQYGIYPVPYMQVQIQSSEIFAGQWWERWNITLTFNEKYDVSEDVGHIESVHVRAEANR
jgi:hypothetical protein